MVGSGIDSESHQHGSYRHNGGRDDHGLHKGGRKRETGMITWQKCLGFSGKVLEGHIVTISPTSLNSLN